PDGKTLLAYADLSRLVAIDLATKRVLWPTPPSLSGHWPGRIDLTSDGSTVLAQRGDSAGNAWLCRLNVVTGEDEERGEPIVRSRGWIGVAPGGQLAAVGRTENGEAYIDLLDLPSGQRTASLRVGAAASLTQSLFSPDGKSLYASAAKHATLRTSQVFGRIWDLGTQRAASPPMAQTGVGAYTPSADRLVTSTEYLLAVRDATGRVRGSGFPLGYEQLALSVGPDGRTLLALASDRTACLGEISAEAEPVPDKQATVKESSPSPRRRGLNVFGADLRADGQIAVSRSHDAAGRAQLRLSDPATGRPLGAPARHHPGWEV